MKAFTIIVRILLIIGGLGIFIFFPIMIKNIDNDAVFQNLNIIVKVSVVMTSFGLIGGVIRAFLLIIQDKR
jgi:NADH:ubiquinone oxidoreductase subunit 6 (subunit J)